MNTLRGTGQINIGGGLRPFHVGTNQTAIFTELLGIDLQDYNVLLTDIIGNAARAAQAKASGEPFTPVGRKEMTGAEHRAFLYASLVAGAQSNGLSVDFSPEMVGNWMDEAEAEEASKPFLMQVKLMADRLARTSGNVPAPPLTVRRGGKSKPKKKK